MLFLTNIGEIQSWLMFSCPFCWLINCCLFFLHQIFRTSMGFVPHLFCCWRITSSVKKVIIFTFCKICSRVSHFLIWKDWIQFPPTHFMTNFIHDWNLSYWFTNVITKMRLSILIKTYNKKKKDLYNVWKLLENKNFYNLKYDDGVGKINYSRK